MGFFSWKTSNTNQSIPSHYSGRETFPVMMVTPDGRKWKEDKYEGYGVFGGKDIYELIAELNGKTTREEGIDLTFRENPSGEFDVAAKNGVILPKLFAIGVTSEELMVTKFDEYSYPESCEFQGYFYDDSDEDEDYEDDYEEEDLDEDEEDLRD